MRFQKTPTKMSGRSICWLMTSCASAPTPVREACGWPGDEGSHVQPFARRHMQACGVWCQPLLSLCGQVRYLRVVPHQHVPIHSAFSRPGLSPLCEPAPRYLGCIDHQHPSHDRPLPQRSARRQGSPVRNSTESLKWLCVQPERTTASRPSHRPGAPRRSGRLVLEPAGHGAGRPGALPSWLRSRRAGRSSGQPARARSPAGQGLRPCHSHAAIGLSWPARTRRWPGWHRLLAGTPARTPVSLGFLVLAKVAEKDAGVSEHASLDPYQLARLAKPLPPAAEQQLCFVMHLEHVS
jgi:hypothetical protein